MLICEVFNSIANNFLYVHLRDFYMPRTSGHKYIVVPLNCPPESILFVEGNLCRFMRFTGLTFFTKSNYSIQALLYFLYVNMVISLVFLASNIFRDVTTATGFTSILKWESWMPECCFYTNVSMPSLKFRMFFLVAKTLILVSLVEMCTRILAVFGYIYAFGSGLLGGFFEILLWTSIPGIS